MHRLQIAAGIDVHTREIEGLTACVLYSLSPLNTDLLID